MSIAELKSENEKLQGALFINDKDNHEHLMKIRKVLNLLVKEVAVLSEQVSRSK